MQLFFHICSFLFGLAFGSFANVCIWRLPRDEGIVFPASHCPACNQPIQWHDNIPLISYLLLRGKCRGCHGHISWRYPAVELASGLLFLILSLRFGPDLRLAGYIPLAWALLVITAIDLDHMIIPDEISLTGIGAGLLFSLAAAFISGLRLQVFDTLAAPRFGPLLDSAAGLALGGCLLMLVAWGGKKAFKQEALGGGDVKLAAMIGAFLGWEAVLLAMFLAFLSGSIAGLALIGFKRIPGRRGIIPFGPFLSLGALLTMLAGRQIIDWYWGWF